MLKNLEELKEEVDKMTSQLKDQVKELNGGQSQVIGPTGPIVAKFGDDIILPCHLEPAMDAVKETFEWSRPDLKPKFVHVRHDNEELLTNQHPSYKGRTSLFSDKLWYGDLSLKLSPVKLSDNGTYKCFVPGKSASTIDLFVGSVSSPVISLAGNDGDKGGVVLDCKSKGWYPEPELLWLDGEGKLLSAGPTETVRGPDDLYTVSSRVTVEKRHSNNFTCRVQQKIINQTRETQIQIADTKKHNEVEEQGEPLRAREEMVKLSQKEISHWVEELQRQLEEDKRLSDELEKKLNSVDDQVTAKAGSKTENKADGYLKLKDIITRVKHELVNQQNRHERLIMDMRKLLAKTQEEVGGIIKDRIKKHQK
ncbi:butyrophilin subfamily 3 member A2-like [Seriola dumerili]|uniref:butyrophilin subfamily 3 member A2-like n=1 Tax=Seriola dumerili TaxID=41447 RepID=UPI000BBE17F9|nr:butyrophilin subfamily 3 member A2-like [Seriola dumerili]